MHGADHFFRNKLDDLNGVLRSYLDERTQDIVARTRVRPDRRRRQLPVA